MNKQPDLIATVREGMSVTTRLLIGVSVSAAVAPSVARAVYSTTNSSVRNTVDAALEPQLGWNDGVIFVSSSHEHREDMLWDLKQAEIVVLSE